MNNLSKETEDKDRRMGVHGQKLFLKTPTTEAEAQLEE
jgi:hypothetical protein